MNARASIAPAVALVIIAGCAAAPGPTPPPPGAVAIAPHVRLDTRSRTVQFDAHVAIDAHHPDTPTVYLELIACAPDTREHESLLVSAVRPSDLHAAMLAAGLIPGSPAAFRLDNGALTADPPRGDPLILTLVTPDGARADPAEWIVRDDGSTPYDPRGYVFAGSRLADRGGVTRYDADGSGTIIGLAAFGSEVIAPRASFSPEAALAAPAWIARAASVPPRGTPVTVEIAPAIRTRAPR